MITTTASLFIHIHLWFHFIEWMILIQLILHYCQRYIGNSLLDALERKVTECVIDMSCDLKRKMIIPGFII